MTVYHDITDTSYRITDMPWMSMTGPVHNYAVVRHTWDCVWEPHPLTGQQYPVHWVGEFVVLGRN